MAAGWRGREGEGCGRGRERRVCRDRAAGRGDGRGRDVKYGRSGGERALVRGGQVRLDVAAQPDSADAGARQPRSSRRGQAVTKHNHESTKVRKKPKRS